jgi:uncharacterized protein YndB with AHSA1/START domain
MTAHGTYETIDGRPALRFERRLEHRPETVWRAITEPEQMKRWFPSTVSGEFRPGGRLSFTFEEHDVPDMEGEVTDVEPPRRLAFYWGDDHLRFELHAEGDACVLRFTAVLDARDKAARDAAGWHTCLDRLEGIVQQTDWQELYAQYEAKGFPSGAPILT